MPDPIGAAILGTAIGNIFSSAVMGGLSAQISALNSAIDKLSAGVGQLGSVFESSLKEASGYEDAVAGLDAVLKSTNNTAGGSRTQLLADAEAYEQATKFSDEMVISAQKVMLTFTNIGATAFPGAMAAAMDLSTVLGQDLQSSAVMVGKALDDPIQGIADLEKAGISFTEEQKNAIKGLMADDKVWQAQGEILGVLESRFGGAARAAGGTFSGQLAILKNSFGDLLQTLGSTFLPLLKDLVQWVNEKIMPAFKNWAEEHAPALQQALRDLADWLKEHVLPAIEGLVKWVVANWPDIQTQILVAWAVIKPVLERMGDVLQVLGYILKLLAGDTQWLSDAISEAWSEIEVAVTVAWNAIQGILEGLGVAFGAIGEILGNIGADIVNGLVTGAEALGQALMVAIEGVLEGLGVAFGAVGEILGNIGADIVNGIIAGVAALGQALIDALVGIIVDAVNAIIQWLGIASPSKVFMEIGAQMVAGLVDAITTKATEISTAMGNAISGTVSAITTRVADFFSAAAKLVLGENQDGNGGIVGGIRAMAAQIVTEMGNAISGARDAIGAKIGEFFDAAKALIVGLDGKGETGLVGGIRSMVTQIATEMGSAISGGVSAITGKVGEFFNAATQLVLGDKDGKGGIIPGIRSKLTDVKTAIENLISGAAGELSSLPKTILDQLGNIGTAIINGLAQGITDPLNKVRDALQGIIDAAIAAIKQKLGIASPSKVFAKIGAEMAAGLAEGFATPPLSATLAAGTMAMGAATANAIYNQQHYYNLTIHSNASTEQVVADFAMLRALAGA